MLEKLKKSVYKANLDIVKLGLVLFTWGNVSALDERTGLIVIKPSGVLYDKMNYEDMTVIDLDCNVVEGKYKPSSDTPTHIEIYKAFKVNAVVHTHSEWATIWAQAGRSIPALGTTHADNFYGKIPVTKGMKKENIQGGYEKETGKIIVERFKDIDPHLVKAVLVKNHGPFIWGDNIEEAVENAAVLEYIAKMAYYSLCINKKAKMDHNLLDKHYLRKHGENAYYGQ